MREDPMGSPKRRPSFLFWIGWYYLSDSHKSGGRISSGDFRSDDGGSGTNELSSADSWLAYRVTAISFSFSGFFYGIWELTKTWW